MPLALVKDRVKAETRDMPFVGVSVLFFWFVTVLVLGGIGWIYPQLVQALELRRDFQRLEATFNRSRLEDKVTAIDAETLKLERERERIKSMGETVPPIYNEQLQRLSRERQVLIEELLSLIRTARRRESN